MTNQTNGIMITGDRYVGEKLDCCWKLINQRKDDIRWEWAYYKNGVMCAEKDDTVISQWQNPRKICHHINSVLTAQVRVINPNEYAA